LLRHKGSCLNQSGASCRRRLIFPWCSLVAKFEGQEGGTTTPQVSTQPSLRAAGLRDGAEWDIFCHLTPLSNIIFLRFADTWVRVGSLYALPVMVTDSLRYL